jgi:ArsR family transcriptional regulator
LPNSTLSHHLDKLKHEGLDPGAARGHVPALHRPHAAGLAELLGFLYAECCTRNKAVEPQRIVCCS